MSHLRICAACVAFFLAVTSVWADDARSVTVNGTGSVSVLPDMAHINLSIVERSTSLDAAQVAVADITAKVLQLLDDLGVERKFVNTSGASVQPNYRWNREKEEQELVGYIAERRVAVELNNLDKLGDLIEGAVKAGVNQVQPPVLDSSKRREAYRQALARAANDARDNAGVIADTLSGTLGRALNINAAETVALPQPVVHMQAAAMDGMAEAAAETYSAGRIRFEAQVTASFELID